jgi:hypothetical protein
MSGPYFPKVMHPTETFSQLASNQPPFYFGGSQVPIYVKPSSGRGMSSTSVKHRKRK